MVFINGKNDLADYGKKDLNEMEAVGSGSRVNIVAELGLLNKGVKRYLVKKDGDTARISSPAVQELGRPDMGDWKHLAEFAAWAKEKYPARRYMLVIWNHGSGWVSNKGISYDDETHNHISTPELGLAMKAIGGVDILAMDACLMQMAEVAYEVKDFAEFIVASEETAPGNGFPYNLMLRGLSKCYDRQTGETAAALVKEYTAYYNSGKTKTKATLSAVKTAALPQLALLTDAWAAAALAYPDKKLLREASNSAACYFVDEYKDLADLAAKVSEKTKDPELTAKGAALISYIRGTLVTANGATSQMSSGSNGISIYVSRDGASERYKALAFSASTRWDEFLASLPRYVPPAPPYAPNPFDPDNFINPFRH